jgi:hypothetical protein
MKTGNQLRIEISENISMYDRQIAILDSSIVECRIQSSEYMSRSDFVHVRECEALITRYSTEKSCFVGARNILQSLLV